MISGLASICPTMTAEFPADVKPETRSTQCAVIASYRERSKLGLAPDEQAG